MDPSQIGVISSKHWSVRIEIMVDFDVLGHVLRVDPSVLGDLQIVLNEQDLLLKVI